MSSHSKVQLEPLERSRRKSGRSEKSLEASEKSLDLDKNLYIVDTNKDGRKGKSEKTKRRRRTRTESPKKSSPAAVERRASHDDTALETRLKENSAQLKSTMPLTTEKGFSDFKTKNPEYSKVQEFNSKGLGTLAISEGDMVAIKVPEKLYIIGQPCLGKITALADHQGLLTVHYYTGSYQGRWKPMMSRTSPYLRKVNAADVLCKFKLTSDGRMSPITQKKLRTVVDDKRNESGEAK